MISKRTKEMTSFIVMDVLERAHEMERQGIHIVHLEVGEPDFDTPQCVKDAACKALDNGHTHYTHSLGLVELREAICEHYLNTYNVTISPDRATLARRCFRLLVIDAGLHGESYSSSVRLTRTRSTSILAK